MPPSSSAVTRPPEPKYTARALLSRISSSLESAALNGLASVAQAGLDLGPEQPALHLTRWHYTQRLHEPWHLVVEGSASDPLIDVASLLWQSAVFWQRDGGSGFHNLSGRIQSISTTGASADQTDYRLTIVPTLCILERSRRERIFQRCTALDAAQKVLAEHGIYPVEVREVPPLARWRHVSQHRDPDAPRRFETDLRFIRRILAAEGMSLWFEEDEAGERVVIGSAGVSGRPIKPVPLGFSAPGGLNAPGGVEQLFDLDVIGRGDVPNIARIWAYNYRDAGRALRAEFEADPKAALSLGDRPGIWEEPCHGADGLLFADGASDENHQEGVQAWLQAQARRLGQRHNQRRETAVVSTNAAGLWRCGQTVNLALSDPGLDQLWLITRVTAGSHVGPDLQPVSEAAHEPGASQACVHVEASPLRRWVQNTWVPEVLPVAALDLEHARIGATPGSTYPYIDPHGRYQLEVNADQHKAEAPPGGTSRPARHVRKHAGADHGWHLPLHGGTEALVAFHGGHPDTPMIAGALHDSSHPDHVTGVNASRNVIRTKANNKLRMEDKQEQEHIKLATESGVSQLNLGHHVDAQGKARGEGLELRTKDWGALRAEAGLLISTFEGQARSGAMASGADGFGSAHQLFNPGSQDAQGAQALAEQRGDANEQVGLGVLDTLKASRRLVGHALDFEAPIVHYASAEHLMQLTPASQMFAAHALTASAQGAVELASADQVRFYAKEGITWHTEGADPIGAGKGGARADILSHGSDEVQVLEGEAHVLAEKDIVLEFRGAKALLSTGGATFELTQEGILTITANGDIVSEAAAHQLGGALDWGSGSGSAAAGPLRWWGKMQVDDICIECLLKAQRGGSPFVDLSGGGDS